MLKNTFTHYKKIWPIGNKICRNKGWLETFAQYCIFHTISRLCSYFILTLGVQPAVLHSLPPCDSSSREKLFNVCACVFMWFCACTRALAHLNRSVKVCAGQNNLVTPKQLSNFISERSCLNHSVGTTFYSFSRSDYLNI